MLAILDYHNKVRGKVFPPASNMEYMVSESFHGTHFYQGVCISTHKLYPSSIFFFIMCSASDQTACTNEVMENT